MASAKMKMIYTIVAYSQYINTVTKIKIDIINGNISDNDPFKSQMYQILLPKITSRKLKTNLI